jgi:hypothetical protein
LPGRESAIDEARKIANRCVFKSDFPHDWESEQSGAMAMYDWLQHREQPEAKPQHLEICPNCIHNKSGDDSCTLCIAGIADNFEAKPQQPDNDGWIRVEDRLPEHGEEVLTITKDWKGNNRKLHYCDNKESVDYGKYRALKDFVCDKWALIAPPKTEKP